MRRTFFHRRPLPIGLVTEALRRGTAEAGMAPLRLPGESGYDMAQRLLVDPFYRGATDAQIAADAATHPNTVARAREALSTANERLVDFGVRAMRSAELVAGDVGWTERDGDLGDLLVAALTDYALRACAAGRCTHELCARQRREKALTEARGRFSRPPHDTRHQQAHSAGERRFLPARGPGDQPRGALPGRTGGGA